MPLYRGSGSNMPQMAQSAMNSATQAVASQEKQTTTIREEKTNWWDDLYKAARAVEAGAGAINSIAGTVEKGTQLYDSFREKSAYNNIAKAFGEGGYEAIQNNPDMQDYWHSIALGKFVKDRANTEKGRLEIMKKADEIADRQYQDFRNQAYLLKGAYEKGDMEQFMPGMEQLVANAPIPYRLKDNGNGGFDEYFRSDEHNGWIKTGRTLSAQQAFEQMNSTLKGEQWVLRGADMKLTPTNAAFNRIAAANYVNTDAGNAARQADPKEYKPLYDKSGNIQGYALKRNPLDNYGLGAQVRVFDGKGNFKGDYNGFDQVLQLGLSPFAPKREGKGRGRGRSGGSGAGGDAGGQAGYGNYKVTEADKRVYARILTSKDPETGEKDVDDMTVADLIDLQRGYGVPANRIGGAFKAARKEFLKRGMGPDEASQAAIDSVRAQLNQHAQGGNTGQPTPQQQGEQTQTVPQGEAAGIDPTGARLLRAAGQAPQQQADPYAIPEMNLGINPANAWSAQERQMGAGARGNMSRQNRSAEIDEEMRRTREDWNPANYGSGSLKLGLNWSGEKEDFPLGSPNPVPRGRRNNWFKQNGF